MKHLNLQLQAIWSNSQQLPSWTFSSYVQTFDTTPRAINGELTCELYPARLATFWYFWSSFFAIPSIHLQDHVAVKGFQSGAGFCNHRIQFNLDKRAPCLRVFRSGSHNLNGDVETVLWVWNHRKTSVLVTIVKYSEECKWHNDSLL